LPARAGFATAPVILGTILDEFTACPWRIRIKTRADSNDWGLAAALF